MGWYEPLTGGSYWYWAIIEFANNQFVGVYSRHSIDHLGDSTHQKHKVSFVQRNPIISKTMPRFLWLISRPAPAPPTFHELKGSF